MILKRRINRVSNYLIAELFYNDSNGNEILVSHKYFGNTFIRSVFNLDLKQKHYDKANKWLDDNTLLHYKNTKNNQ